MEMERFSYPLLEDFDLHYLDHEGTLGIEPMIVKKYFFQEENLMNTHD